MEEAERIAREEHDSWKIAVISGRSPHSHCLPSDPSVGVGRATLTLSSLSFFLLALNSNVFESKASALETTTAVWGTNWMGST